MPCGCLGQGSSSQTLPTPPSWGRLLGQPWAWAAGWTNSAGWPQARCYAGPKPGAMLDPDSNGWGIGGRGTFGAKQSPDIVSLGIPTKRVAGGRSEERDLRLGLRLVHRHAGAAREEHGFLGGHLHNGFGDKRTNKARFTIQSKFRKSLFHSRFSHLACSHGINKKVISLLKKII